MTMYGFDTSSYQGGLRVGTVNGASFVIPKATGGTRYVNPYCNRQYKDAKKLGWGRGTYHFAHDGASGGTAAQEAAAYVKNTKGYVRDGVQVLDLEAPSLINSNPVAWAETWLGNVGDATGVAPLIYMPPWVVNAYNWSNVAKTFGLWLPSWPDPRAHTFGGHTKAPAVKWWDFVAIWQYTDQGRIGGWSGYVDLDVALMDRAAWNLYANPAAATKTKPKAKTKPAPKPAPKPKPAKPATPKDRVYIVKRGDTLAAIATKYHTTVKHLATLNKIKNANVIRVGQQIRIDQAKPVAKSATIYTVKSGDTLGGIAARYHTTVHQLAVRNQIKNANVIRVGEKIKIN